MHGVNRSCHIKEEIFYSPVKEALKEDDVVSEQEQGVSSKDKAYVGRMVAEGIGISDEEAQKRVNAIAAQLRTLSWRRAKQQIKRARQLRMRRYGNFISLAWRILCVLRGNDWWQAARQRSFDVSP